MEASELREKCIVEYLAKIGHKPSKKKKSGKYHWFCSPLRAERDPSFTVNKGTNKWVDRGTGEHGSIIDLVMKLEGLCFKDACKFLSDERVPVKKFEAIDVHECGIDILEIKELSDIRLLSYMRSRKISDRVSKLYCKEVYYYYTKENKADQKALVGVGFRNSLGGYEVRNGFDKTSVLPKTFTRIKGDSSKYVLFEGFISYLSALEHYKIEKFKYDAYILNGTGLINLLLPFISDKEGYFYTDNDDAGTRILKGLKGRDMRDTYSGYNDFNDLLCGKKIL